MTYLSKGMVVPPDSKPVFRICRWGKIHALGPEAEMLWRRGCTGLAEASEAELTAVRRLADAGLLSITEETGSLAAFCLLNNCVLCPSGKGPRFLWGRERRIWTWLTRGGLRLTSSELIRLEERKISPVPELLGESGRQALTEEIYTNANILDGILETEMEHSPARDAVTASILKLIRKRHLLLI